MTATFAIAYSQQKVTTVIVFYKIVSRTWGCESKSVYLRTHAYTRICMHALKHTQHRIIL